MRERDDFLDEMLPRLVAAEKAIHEGDPAPRSDTWSHNDPVTLFGAFGGAVSGWDAVSRAFELVASRFSNNTAYDIEVVAADVSGDLAYTVAHERHTTSIDGGPPQSKVLRVTHVYRRENGEWKIVHRHGDELVEPPRSAPSTS